MSSLRISKKEVDDFKFFFCLQREQKRKYLKANKPKTYKTIINSFIYILCLYEENVQETVAEEVVRPQVEFQICKRMLKEGMDRENCCSLWSSSFSNG
jgi:hypothetical protein